jgi:hypothetical protein
VPGVRLRSQGWFVAALRRKSNGDPMTDTANHNNLAGYVGDVPAKRNMVAKGIGILRLIFDAVLNAMYESCRTRAEREIANFVARRGGRITDEFEREMARHLFTSDWSRRE